MKRAWKPLGFLGMVSLLASSLALAADERLVNAAADQDNNSLKTLLKQGVKVNDARADGSTALLWAAHWNEMEIVDLLLKAGAKVDLADDHGVTPLSQAVENGNVPLVDRLLKAGANPNAALISGMTPLMTACHTGNIAIVKLLLAKGANVNAATSETKNTALMWAVADKFPEIAKLLIDAKADPHASTSKGFTSMMYAARNGDIEMAKMLIAAGVNVNEVGTDQTHVLPYSIVTGQADFAMFLIEQGADPNGQMGGVRALHVASGGVDLWLGDWDRKHGGGSNYLTGSGFGARTIDPTRAVPIIKALLAHGADPNARTTSSSMMMSYIGHPTKGAFEPFSCGTGEMRGATPLWVAAYAANQSFGGGRGPAQGAGAAGAAGADAAAGAAAAGAQAQARGAAAAGGGGRGGRGGRGGGRNNMGQAGGATTSDVIRALLDGGADYHLTTDDGSTPLMMAAGLGRATFSPGLKRGGRAAGAEEAVRILVEAGADVNQTNEADFTALHGAAMRGLDEVIQYLVEHGANINARDFRGRTAYRMAEGSKQSFQFQAYPETAEFIKKLGANTNLGIPGTVQERVRDVPAKSP